VLKTEDASIIDVAGNVQRLSERMNGAFSNSILLLGSSHPLQDSPAHAPIRAGLKTILSDIMRRWPPEKLEDFAIRLLTKAADAKRVDAVRFLAGPMAGEIIADGLGLELQQVYRCNELTRDVSSMWYRGVHALRELRAMEESATELVDILSSRYEGSRRSEYASLSFLTMAGVETSTSLLSSAIHLLSRDQALLQRLRAEPGLVNGLISETLRRFPPLRRILGRKTEKDVTLSGQTIPRNAALAVDIESAHHDPDAYPDPERIDLTRTGPPTLAFGAGAHACLGAGLARMEAKVFIDCLIRDFIVHPAGEAQRRPSRDWFEFDSVPIRLQRI
jgi:cytochrome P450